MTLDIPVNNNSKNAFNIKEALDFGSTKILGFKYAIKVQDLEKTHKFCLIKTSINFFFLP